MIIVFFFANQEKENHAPRKWKQNNITTSNYLSKKMLYSKENVRTVDKVLIFIDILQKDLKK